MLKFFRIPFATSGDRASIPDASDPSGFVSYTDGYPIDYEQDPTTDPLTAKDIERDKMNQLLFDLSTALKELQSHTVPDFITSALNGGSPWSYDKYDTVRWNDGVETFVYESLVGSNTSLPSDTTKWRKLSASQYPVGGILEYDGSALIDGWIWADGKTIGNASSNATNRANIDCLDLFTLIWNSYSNTVRPIYTSAGVATTRGASAAADWAANKAITVKDKRGFVSAGKDDMGGTAANRLTSSNVLGVNGAVLGATGGEQMHALTVSENGPHTHQIDGYSLGNTGAGYQLDRFAAGNETGTGFNFQLGSGASGSGSPHNNVQPTTISNFLIKL